MNQKEDMDKKYNKLIEEWQWTCKDYSKGASIIEEL
jgi:hypothetical protein